MSRIDQARALSNAGAFDLHPPRRGLDYDNLLRMTQELLAVLHRDGGHHTAKVGLRQSIEDAKKRVADERSRVFLLFAR